MYLLDRVDQSIRKMKSNAANIMTIGNLSFGGAAIISTLNENYSYSVLFIFIAALLDRLDGMVARKFGTESELGKQLDSMSDIISFGMAPAILMYTLILNDFGTIGAGFAIIYMASGAFRLARFNLTESDGYFTGLPITVAGTLLTFSYFFIQSVPAPFYLLFTLILSCLMISTFKLKKV